MRHTTNHTGGYTLIELLVYTGLLVVISGIFVTVLVRSIGSSNELHEMRSVRRSARIALERMSRDMHQAYEVSPLSELGSDPGRLVLHMTDLGPSGAIEEYYLSSSDLYVSTDGGPPVRLTDNATDVVSLVFHSFASGADAEGVRAEITLEGAKTGRVTLPLYVSAVLRGSYID